MCGVATAGCIKEAIRDYSLNPAVFYAILSVESGMNPYALEIMTFREDKNIPCPFVSSGRRKIYSCVFKTKGEAIRLLEYAHSKGYDYSVGLGQINRWWVDKLGLNPKKLLNPCYNSRLSAYILDLCWKRYGDSWKTIDCYNKGEGRASEVSAYVLNIYKELERWRGK